MCTGDSRLGLVPVTLDEAGEFVRQLHRHHRPPRGARFAIGAALAGEIVGVAIVGRPLAHELQDGWTAEVTRLCTDETRNACSKLYAAAWRAWRAMGGRRMVTYTLASESGASVRGAGWRVVAEVSGREWNSPSRPRVERAGVQTLDKLRWEPVVPAVLSLIGPERSEGPSVAPRRSPQVAREGRSCGHTEDTSCKPAVFASERLPR